MELKDFARQMVKQAGLGLAIKGGLTAARLAAKKAGPHVARWLGHGANVAFIGSAAHPLLAKKKPGVAKPKPRRRLLKAAMVKEAVLPALPAIGAAALKAAPWVLSALPLVMGGKKKAPGAPKPPRLKMPKLRR